MAEAGVEVARQVERAFRAEGGAALATIARRTGDVQLAEDAVQEAFALALEHWPRTGVPDRPGAWITTTARNRALDVLRRERRRPERELAAASPPLPPSVDEVLAPDPHDEVGLLFACCHPALPPATRVALTLRLVCGLQVPEIARVLLQGEEAVSKRLQRGKQKVRDAGIPLHVPPRSRLRDRLPSVLQCTYLTFTEGHAATRGPDVVRDELCDDATRLAALLVDELPDEAAVHALAALLLLVDARRPARLAPDGRLLVLAEQDRRRWDRGRTRRGLVHLTTARSLPDGAAAALPYVLQAAIAAEHTTAPTWEATDWPRIVALYDELEAVAPTPVVGLNRAIAVAHAGSPGEALVRIDELADRHPSARAHLWDAARADALLRLGRTDEAIVHLRRARSGAPTPAERAHLDRRLTELGQG